MRFLIVLSLCSLGCSREEFTPFVVGDQQGRAHYLGGSGANDLFFVSPTGVKHRAGTTLTDVPGTQSFATSLEVVDAIPRII